MSTCTTCPRSAADHHHLCQLHAGELRAWLAELPGLAELLAEFLASAGAPVQGRLGSTGRAHAPAPVDLRVLALLGPGHADTVGPDDDGTVPILVLLYSWAGYIAYSYPAVHRDLYGTQHTAPCEQARPRRGDSITGWCVWLTAYLPYVLAHPWAGELHRQLGDLIARLRDLTHSTPHEHPITVAACPTCNHFALARIDGHDGVTCQACGHHLDPEAYREHAARILDAHQTATAA
ncbi:hypothetical protein ACWD11_22690 [Streptomyces sp. NPDC002776]